jgi:hypothetical protein
VHVIGVPIVGGAGGDDRTQARRAAGGHLKGVESPPGDAHHPRAPVAPRLRGEPGEHLLGVVELLLEVFVGQHPLRIAAAAQIDPDPGVSVSSQVGVEAIR